MNRISQFGGDIRRSSFERRFSCNRANRVEVIQIYEFSISRYPSEFKGTRAVLVAADLAAYIAESDFTGGSSGTPVLQEK